MKSQVKLRRIERFNLGLVLLIFLFFLLFIFFFIFSSCYFFLSFFPFLFFFFSFSSSCRNSQLGIFNN